MRILQVTAIYYPELQFGGPPQKIHGLNRALLQAGHEIRVATFHSQHPGKRQFAEYDGVSVHYVPWFGRGTWQFPLAAGHLHELVRWAEVVLATACIIYWARWPPGKHNVPGDRMCWNQWGCMCPWRAA